jgi:DNA-binding NtrC family response regulator
MSESLQAVGFKAAHAATAADAASRLEGFAYDAVIVDVRLSDGDGLDVLDTARALYPDIKAIVVTNLASVQHAVRAMRAGAVDYLLKPDQLGEIPARLTEAFTDRRREGVPVRSRSARPAASFDGIVGSSAAMRKLFTTLELVAPMHTTTLIQGETGTGKELVARTIHDNSPRRDRPFVAFNAAAIPETLAETELFGHVKGAFTGAVYSRMGKFESADGGTLFIDEVSSMSLSLQAKLLRTLQEREIERVGGGRTQKINARVLAASNVDLQDMVKEGTFRADLFYRLSVIKVTLPALRERIEDIPDLARYFVDDCCRRHDMAGKTLSQSTLQSLMTFDWPGNIRHLQNAVEHAVAMSGESLMIEPDALPDEVRAPHAVASESGPIIALPATPEDGINFQSTMSDVERELILRYLEKAGGNKRRAARLLNLSRTTLIDKLHRLGVAETAA